MLNGWACAVTTPTQMVRADQYFCSTNCWNICPEFKSLKCLDMDPLKSEISWSVSFDPDEESPLQTSISQSNFGRSSSHKAVLEKQASVLAMADSANSDDSTSPPSKYKSSLLNRYLNDTLRHMMVTKADGVTSACKRRSHSESFSSNECDRDVVSPASSYETEANFVYHMGERKQIRLCSEKPSHLNRPALSMSETTQHSAQQSWQLGI